MSDVIAGDIVLVKSIEYSGKRFLARVLRVTLGGVFISIISWEDGTSYLTGLKIEIDTDRIVARRCVMT